MVDPIGKMLKEMNTRVEGLGQTGAGLDAQLKNFAEDQRMLRQETQKSAMPCRHCESAAGVDEAKRQLAARVRKPSGMIEILQHTQQAISDRGRRLVAHRPDFIDHAARRHADLHSTCQGAIEPYSGHAMDSAGQQAAQTGSRALDRFPPQTALRYLKTLKSREYWRHFDGSPEFVVMFLPTEGLYSLAVSNDPALIEDAANAHVILASPTTLMGLLRVAMHGLLVQQQNR